MTAPRRDRVQSLDRAFDLLEALGALLVRHAGEISAALGHRAAA